MDTLIRTGSIGEAYVERSRIGVDGDEGRTVVGQRIPGEEPAFPKGASRGDYPSIRRPRIDCDPEVDPPDRDQRVVRSATREAQLRKEIMNLQNSLLIT